MGKIYIGIDPGQKGAIAFIRADGVLLEACPLRWEGGDLSGDWLAKIFIAHCSSGATYCAVEKAQSMPNQSISATFNYGYGAGKIAGVLESLQIPYQLIPPQAWKKTVLEGTDKDKDAAIAYVRRAYPSANLLPGNKRTPHDGVADAICLAEHVRRLGR